MFLLYQTPGRYLMRLLPHHLLGLLATSPDHPELQTDFAHLNWPASANDWKTHIAHIFEQMASARAWPFLLHDDEKVLGLLVLKRKEHSNLAGLLIDGWWMADAVSNDFITGCVNALAGFARDCLGQQVLRIIAPVGTPWERIVSHLHYETWIMHSQQAAVINGIRTDLLMYSLLIGAPHLSLQNSEPAWQIAEGADLILLEPRHSEQAFHFIQEHLLAGRTIWDTQHRIRGHLHQQIKAMGQGPGLVCALRAGGIWRAIFDFVPCPPPRHERILHCLAPASASQAWLAAGLNALMGYWLTQAHQRRFTLLCSQNDAHLHKIAQQLGLFHETMRYDWREGDERIDIEYSRLAGEL